MVGQTSQALHQATEQLGKAEAEAELKERKITFQRSKQIREPGDRTEYSDVKIWS
jgi:hypothetical protein